MKVLFIRYKKSVGVFEGGERGTEEKLQTIYNVVGKENVDVYHIHDENKKKTIIDYLSGAFYFLFNYYFGLTPKRVKEIDYEGYQLTPIGVGIGSFNKSIGRGNPGGCCFY